MSPLDLSTSTHVVACVRALVRRAMTSGHPRVACAAQRVAGIIQADADTTRTTIFTSGLSSCAPFPAGRPIGFWSIYVTDGCLVVDVFHTAENFRPQAANNFLPGDWCSVQ